MPFIDDFIVEIETDSAHKTTASAPSSPEGRRIPKVPQALLSLKNWQQYFEPAAVSMGPYHHGNTKYERVEIIKRKLVRQFFAELMAPVRDIYDKIHDQIKEVRDYYEKHLTDGFDDEKLTFMMLLDGAFLILCVLFRQICFSAVTIRERSTFLRDFVLLENQIPRMVIEVFLDSIGGLNSKFFCFGHPSFPFFVPVAEWDREMGTAVDHLLHKLQMTSTGDGQANKVANKGIVFQRKNVREIMAKGIRLKGGKPGNFDSVSFSSGCIYGELIVPPLFMDDFTLTYLSNLIAYEKSRGHSNYQCVITSYICFLDSLIDGVEDILELQSAGIVYFSKCSLHQEEDLFIFIKEIALNFNPDSGNYFHASAMIRKHMEAKWRINIGTWLTEVSMVYCRSPWTGIAVLAGFVLFFLTATQTYFTIFPRK